MNQHLIKITTLGDLILHAAEKWPDNEVLVFPDKRLTYAHQIASQKRRPTYKEPVLTGDACKDIQGLNGPCRKN